MNAVTQRFTYRQLLQMDIPEPKWVVEGLIPEGLTILAGAPKVGKSFFVYQLIQCVASGRPFLGKFPCAEGSALYFALEDSASRLLSRGTRIEAELGGLSEDQADRIEFFTDWPKLKEEGLKSLKTAIQNRPGTVIVVIDVMASARPAGKGEYQDDYDFVRSIQKIAIEKGIAIILVHHTRKMGAIDPQDQISGTNGIAGASDNNLILVPSGAQTAELSVRGRELSQEIYNLRRSGILWTLEASEGTAGLSPERAEIQRFLTQNGPSSPDDIAKGTNRSGDAIRQLVRSMKSRGQINWDKTGIYSAIAPPDEEPA